MATTLRRLSRVLGWWLVMCIASLPVWGILFGLWPDEDTSIADLSRLLAYQGLGLSLSQSMFSALFSSLVSLYLAFLIYSQYQSHSKVGGPWLEKYLSPLLSLPHLAIALGLVFLFSESGVFFVNGDIGLPRKGLSTFIMAIIIKEVPFFLLILIAVGRQLPLHGWLLQGRALGYDISTSWWLLVFPNMLKQMRLALLAASAYTLSVVDMNLLVGPNIPELFAVSVYRWQGSFSEGDQALGFWANVLLLVLLAVSIIFLYCHEKLAIKVLQHWTVLGRRIRLGFVDTLGQVWLPASGLLILLMVLVFTLWSLGFNWRSDTFSLRNLNTHLWQDEWLFVALPLQNALLIGVSAAILGIMFTLLALELQRQKGRYLPDYIWLLGILLPQLSMVLGWQVSHIWLEGGYHSGWVVFAHFPFTFGYAYLVLKGPFQSIDANYELIAASFGYSPWQRWWKIRFRLLFPATLSAFAITFAVSIAQYIPTLMIGAGRVTTITTEAVAIGTGSQQDVAALYILLQSLLPLAAFLITALLSSRVAGPKHSTLEISRC
ncbi:ABC transporter permease subunit [Paraglaciecola marina]|uniref:ABC transporter permease subunit n=1 Tax=Paraglaciecola marina TaxID=2500157 RepID=UPI00105E2D30|nr:ABC transporter permease subunit [Paraglaciecola marina]